MTSIGSGYYGYSSGAAWQDLQAWQDKMKAANDQFESDTSQYTDTLLNAPVSQTQGMTTILSQEISARSAKATQPAAASSPGDVYWGDSVQQTNGGNLGSSSTPAGGSSNDVFWGNPQLDISV